MRLLLSGLDTVECAYYLRPVSACKIDFAALREQRETIRQSRNPESGALKLGDTEFMLSPCDPISAAQPLPPLWPADGAWRSLQVPRSPPGPLCGHHCQRPADIPVETPEQASLILCAISHAISQPGHARAVLMNDEHAETVYLTDDYVAVGHTDITEEVGKAGAVLIAWGALGERCGDWMELILDEIKEALPLGSELYCLAKTKGGHPKHPMARGKHKVPMNATLIPWSAA